MIVWILIAAIGSEVGITVEVGDVYRTEAACNKARNEIIVQLPEGKPIAVGCVAQKLKAV